MAGEIGELTEMTEITKHTRGPWFVREHHDCHEDDVKGVEVVSADGTIIACNRAYYPTELDADNAHIIAAAPELLEMTKLFRESIEYYIRKDKAGDDLEGAAMKQFMLNMVNAVIDKATGNQS